ncbi:MAG: phage portal protein family protein [Elusimicrobiota bacterium]
MGFVSNLLGYQEVNLSKSAVSLGAPIGTNKGVTSKDRVKRELLEEDYRFDPVIFSIINKPLQFMMHAGFKIKTKTARWQKRYDDFFENIGQIGEETTIDELAEYILQDMLMYGNSFVELVYDAKTDSKVVDLHILPEKKMDYAKNANGEIVTDRFGRPVGYVMEMPFGYDAGKQGDQVPEQFKRQVSRDPNQIFFLPKRIAHFKLFTYGQRFYGLGLIEPAHTASYRKRMIEEARANEIYTRGANTIIASVGDENHEAGTQELTDVLNQIANFKHDRYFAFPRWVKIDTLPIDQNHAVDDTLKYLTVSQATSAGIPLSLATGNGEATNRSTLAVQQQVLEVCLEDIIRKFSSCFNKFVLRRIAKTNKIPEVAEVVWGDIRSEEKNDKAKRIQQYVKYGIIAPEEARDYVNSTEDLEIDDEKYKSWKNPKGLPPEDTKNPEENL